MTRDGVPAANYPMSRVNPKFIDVMNDDMATIYLQYSTQRDSLADIGRLFDGDRDGKDTLNYNRYDFDKRGLIV